MKNGVRTIGCILIAGILGACGDSSSPARLSTGSYIATEFTTSGTGGQTNQLLNGGSLNITLASNGTTSGHLHIAGSGSQPAFDADMAGTWREQGTLVEFDQPADTFVRDMQFTAGAGINGTWTLSGTGGFSGTGIQLTLTRQP